LYCIFRKHPHHNGIRKVHKGSSNDTSPEEDTESNLCEVKKLSRQKCKLQKWKTVACSSSSKYMRETVGKPESSHRQQKPHESQPSSHAHQRKVCKKPSLKWKFCHAVASVVTTHDSSVRNAVDDITGSGSESDMGENKPEIQTIKASSAHSKKKKKRKSTAGQKKPRRILSASSVPSTSGKQTRSKKLIKT
jgi:hypothetical protein